MRSKENVRNIDNYINVREYRRDNQKMDNPEKNRQLRVHKTKKTKQKHNTICVGHHYTQTNTYIVNKTRALLQTTRGKDEQNIGFMWKS